MNVPAISAGVVIAGLVFMYAGWLWLDPAVSLIITAIIVWGTWSLRRDSVAMSHSAAPPEMDASKVRAYLESVEGVSSLHDLHIWSMSTTDVALTVHLVMPGGHPGDTALLEIAHELTTTSVSVTQPSKSRPAKQPIADLHLSTWSDGKRQSQLRFFLMQMPRQSSF